MSGGAEGEDRSLDALQAWLADAIARPLPVRFEGNPLESTAPELAAEGDARVRGGGGLSGFARVGLYHRQYWFRLVSVLQSEHPCAVHVLGLEAYNAWAIRYLTAHPPDSPYLARLDGAWLPFLEANYPGSGAGGGPARAAVLQAAAVDRAFSRAVDAPAGEPLAAPGEAIGEAADPAALLARPLRLAPHAEVLRLDWDFPAFRALCLADESLEARFEPVPKALNLLVWRGRDMGIWQKPVSSAARLVLEALRAPALLSEAFAGLEARLGASERDELEANLADWFAEWAREGILCGAGDV